MVCIDLVRLPQGYRLGCNRNDTARKLFRLNSKFYHPKIDFFPRPFYPHIYEDIDFGKDYEFLDKELRKIIRANDAPGRYADELVKVYMKTGDERWLLIHIEVQGYKDPDFAKRMFSYYYRIYDKYQKEVISLAILTDGNKIFRPSEYRQVLYGIGNVFTFGVVKLIDFDEEDLEKSNNPFAMVVLAHLRSLKIGKDNQQKYNTRLNLMRLFLDKDIDKKKIRQMFNFLEWMMSLPEELELKLMEEVGGETMSYVSIWERKGIEKGMQKGMQKDRLQIAQKMKQKNMDINLISEITGLSKEEIAKLPTKLHS